MRIVKKTVVPGLLILFFFLMQTPAKGMEKGQNIRIDLAPSIFVLKGQAGDTVSRNLEIINKGDTGYLVKIAAANYELDGSGQSAYVSKARGEGTNIADWVTFGENNCFIAPGTAKKIKINIHIPKNIFGNQYSTKILVQPEIKGGNIITIPTLAATAYINVSAPGKGAPGFIQSARLDEFAIPFVNFDTAKMKLSLSNTGSSFLDAQGEVKVYKKSGAQRDSLMLDRFFVPKGEKASFAREWPGPDLFGYYRAVLEVNYGNQQKLVGEASFIVIPLQLLVIVLVMALVVGVFLWRKIRPGRAYKKISGEGFKGGF